jgi:starch phosphorylase
MPVNPTLIVANAATEAERLYRDPKPGRTAILNIAHTSKFSSDRTIAEYAADICDASPWPGALNPHNSGGQP